MIGIDSMILVYAGLVPRGSDAASKKQSELSVRAQLLLQMKKEETIVLPTVAMSEVLVPVTQSRRGLLMSKLSEIFLLASFDSKAAAICAALWNEHKKQPSATQYRTRHVLKADAMIIATAKAAGATAFYTNDSKCRKLASLIMAAHELPEHDPDDMFLRGDVERGEV